MNAAPLLLLVRGARPRTLLASLAPVAVGTAAAERQGGGDLALALWALATAVALQVAANLINDWADHRRGADGPDRVGPTRLSQSGAISPRAVGLAGAGALAVGGLLGLALVARAGWPALALGGAAIAAAAAYTAGPRPLAYHGLGEPAAFLFFGPVAVCGTELVQAGSASRAGLVASLPIGLLAAAILLANDVRDADTDRRAGKRTPVVRLGRDAGRRLYAGAVGLAFATPLVGAVAGALPPAAAAAALAAPLALRPLQAMHRSSDPEELDRALGATARLELTFAVLLAGGLVA